MLDSRGLSTRRLSVAEIERRVGLFEEWQSGRFVDLDFDRPWSLTADAALWRFAISDQGFYCMVPLQAREHDRIVVVHGAKVPIVLRSASVFSEYGPALEKGSGGKETYKFVGPTYLHAFMDGRAAEWAEVGKLEERSFVLV